MTNETLQLWESVSKTDPNFTKGFSRSGGFKGTAINALYLIRRATELWGPFGGRWGATVVEEKILDGAPLLIEGQVVGCEKVHEIRIELFHPNGKVPGVGQTMFVSRNKNGFFTDEEAPKKSLTDAVTKALSWLGFSADVHMGLYDDNKYVNQLRKEFAEVEQLSKESGAGHPDGKGDVPPPRAVKITPIQGAADRVEQQDREALEGLALDVIEAARANAAEHAAALCSDVTEADQKVYLWSLLPSDVRSAIKKVTQPTKEAA